MSGAFDPDAFDPDAFDTAGDSGQIVSGMGPQASAVSLVPEASAVDLIPQAD